MKYKYRYILIITLFVATILALCDTDLFYDPLPKGRKTVLCVPVYGQSLALGEEATRITNFDSLRIKSDGRIITENLDYKFGYFDHSSEFKENIKKLFHDRRKAFELSAYSMAEFLAFHLGNDTLICIFPGGHGMTSIGGLIKPTPPYNKFVEEIERAYKQTKKRGWDFIIPAICWMQGESDIVNYPGTDYKKYFKMFCNDINKDIKKITHKDTNIRIICYQTNAVTKGERYKTNNYYALEPIIPEAQMELIRDDSMLWASGPTYPYTFVNENIHIDAIGQKSIGILAAQSVLGILRNNERFTGLIPLSTKTKGNTIYIHFNVPSPPLCFDTINVKRTKNFGFSVITDHNIDIASEISLANDTVIIKCTQSPKGCKIRYAVNGEYMKSGKENGPRGNLRDSQGEKLHYKYLNKIIPIHNWCLQFEIN